MSAAGVQGEGREEEPPGTDYRVNTQGFRTRTS